tara:strand:+ start:2391 stop:2582 length:192 start_codon:yes stop_codon:yes gene_type:complete
MNEQKKSKHKFVNVNGYLKVIEIKPTVKTKDIFEGYKDDKKKKTKKKCPKGHKVCKCKKNNKK